MEQCIVAVFDNRSAAQQAQDELAASGFARQDVRLSEGRPAADLLPASGIKPMLSHIFGAEHSDESRLYDEALSRGKVVLTVMASDDDQVDLATAIVDRFKPVDLEQQSPRQSQQWRGAGMPGPQTSMGSMGGGQGASMQGASAQGSMQGTLQGTSQGTLQGQMQESGGQGSQQFAPPGSGSDAGLARGGVRVYPRPLPGALESLDAASPAMDKYFRSHWNRNYASHGHTFDDYAPAYRYGVQMAGSDQYQGRKWTEIEPAVKREWQASNPGSAWEKFKAAIRHGWEGAIS